MLELDGTRRWDLTSSVPTKGLALPQALHTHVSLALGWPSDMGVVLLTLQGRPRLWEFMAKRWGADRKGEVR